MVTVDGYIVNIHDNNFNKLHEIIFDDDRYIKVLNCIDKLIIITQSNYQKNDIIEINIYSIKTYKLLHKLKMTNLGAYIDTIEPKVENDHIIIKLEK